MAVSMIGPKFYAWDRNGKPLAFGKLYTYQARTNVPKDTYQSEDQVVKNENPVILNGEGYADVYLDGSYKMVLKDEKNNEIWSADPVTSSKADEWINCRAAEYVSPKSFSMAGNLTSDFDKYRKVRIDNDAAEFSYSAIVGSSYGAGVTTVTVLDAVVTTSIKSVCSSITGKDSAYLEPASLFSGEFESVESLKGGVLVGGYDFSEVLPSLINESTIGTRTHGYTDVGTGSANYLLKTIERHRSDISDPTWVPSDDGDFSFYLSGLGDGVTYVAVPNEIELDITQSGLVPIPGNDAYQALSYMVSKGAVKLLSGNFDLSASINYESNKNIKGNGKSFSGTSIIPDGDFPAFYSDGASQKVKMSFSDFLIDAVNNTSSYAVVIDSVFLSDFYNIWVRNSFNGVEILNSDALNFYSLMVMEDSDGDAVLVGEGSRNIRFVSCNFEKNPNNTNPGGIFRIDGGDSSRVADAVLTGCSFERSGVIVENGRVTVTGGKFGASSLILKQKSQLCMVDSKFEDSGVVFDAGFSNVVLNVFCRNMATPKHEWPVLEQAAAGSTPLFGSAGDEILFLTTAGSLSNVGVTGGVIEIKDGATVLDTSPSFDLPAPGQTIGLPTRPLYSHISAVKVPTTSAGPIFTGSKCFGISGGINLLVNGTFDSGLATGWGLNSVVESPNGSDVLLLPTDTSWGIYQAISSICKYGKRYLVVARFNGNANLTLGDSWNGTAGSRVLYDSGQILDDGSGDSLAMVAFQYNFQRGNVSLGKLGADSAVTVKYFMMIEVG